MIEASSMWWWYTGIHFEVTADHHHHHYHYLLIMAAEWAYALEMGDCCISVSYDDGAELDVLLGTNFIRWWYRYDLGSLATAAVFAMMYHTGCCSVRRRGLFICPPLKWGSLLLLAV